uniref:Chorion peroxidase n=1 Tax=Cacopsylla melanoneura TaxID=428564 RepID=A0A8D8SWS8_9HEMI
MTPLVKLCLTLLIFDAKIRFSSLHEIHERIPAPEPEPEPEADPARGGYGYTRYNRESYSRESYYNSGGSNYPSNNGYGSGSGYGRNLSPINKSKAQSEPDQNIADQCFQQTSCNPGDKYRTADGTCNNLRRTWWGSVNTAHVRLMRPYYEDGVSEYRVSRVDSSELPSARLLSRTFLPDLNISDIHTRMYLQFSQLVAHDVTLNPQVTSGPAKCCSESGDAVESKSGVCRPISVPRNDDFYSQFDRNCLEYKQSESINCSTVDPLQPIVRSTHFIDVSFMYGSLPDKARELRTGSRGQMRVRSVNGKDYLPTAAASSCPFAKKNCYDAGDIRVNQHLDLAVTQTVWLRVHNHIANKLIQLNPGWSKRDELVYQETRRIVIAFFQHITYAEWLPILIGSDFARTSGLSPTNSGYFVGYNPDVNPSTLADFAGAAFRGLHSLIPGVIRLANERRATNQELPFSSTLQHPGDFMEEGDTYDSTLRGLGSQKQQFQDRWMTEQITNFMIDEDVPQRGQGQFGDDLCARDIQRGRDFGLRPYVEYRELCGLSPARSFRDLNDFIDADQVQLLSRVYRGVGDVDYYIGGLLENVIRGTLSSPSFRCVFGEAFYRYKFGDRYFYEGAPSYNPGAFSQVQLNAIKKVLLSQIMCIGSDNISSMQLRAFYQPLQSNPVVSCAQLISDFDQILNTFQVGGGGGPPPPQNPQNPPPPPHIQTHK